MEEINTEKIKTQMRKGILEMCILSAINKSKEAYVSDLIDALKSADMIVVEGTLYPLLHPTEERWTTRLPMERIDLGASTQILCAYRRRQTLSWRNCKSVAWITNYDKQTHLDYG